MDFGWQGLQDGVLEYAHTASNIHNDMMCCYHDPTGCTHYGPYKSLFRNIFIERIKINNTLLWQIQKTTLLKEDDYMHLKNGENPMQCVVSEHIPILHLAILIVEYAFPKIICEIATVVWNVKLMRVDLDKTEILVPEMVPVFMDRLFAHYPAALATWFLNKKTPQQRLKRLALLQTWFPLKHYLQHRCSVTVVDNFLAKPMQTRQFVLEQTFETAGNFPGRRTKSFATPELQAQIQDLLPHHLTITNFPMHGYNGAYQYTTSRDHSWIHCDGMNNWACVLFLTPDAPLSAGTVFYFYKDKDKTYAQNQTELDQASQDMTKWNMVNRVGNVFNRLVLFDSTQFHMSGDYFGFTKETARLFQVFFFDAYIIN